MNIAKKSIICMVRGYQKNISPLCKSKCRFVPTCSNYFVEAVEKFGAMKGTILGIGRIVRCNPFSKGGFDPVPENLVGEYRWLL